MKFQKDWDIKGVWIPIEVYEDENLSHSEKFLLVEIDHLDRGEGCWKSDSELAKWLKCSVSHLQNMMTSLRKRGYVKTLKSDGRKRWLRVCFSRHLTPTKNSRSGPFGPTKNSRSTLRKKVGVNHSYDTSYHTRDYSNTKEEYSRGKASAGASPTASRDGSFFDFGDEVDPFIKQIVQALEDFIRKSRKLNGKRFNRKKWYDDIRLLLQDIDGDRQRLQNIVEMFVEYPHDEYTPRVSSAGAFREKFDKIEHWISSTIPEVKQKSIRYKEIVEEADEGEEPPWGDEDLEE